MAGGLIQPLRSALDLAQRRQPLFAWLGSWALGVGTMIVARQVYADGESSSPIELTALLFLVPAAISALIIMFLARALLADAAHYGPPLYGRFVGLYAFAVILVTVVQGVGEGFTASLDSPGQASVFGLAFAGALGSAAVFPLMVRCFATAAGIAEPRLGTVWSFVFTTGRGAYFWYVAGTFALYLLGAALFVSRFPNGGGDLIDTLTQGAIDATSQIMPDLLAIAHEQDRLMHKAALTKPKLLLLDTDPLMTAAWAEMLFGEVPDELLGYDKAELYLLFAPDVPWVKDGTRFFGTPKQRAKFAAVAEDMLVRTGVPYQRISGDWDERERQVHAAID